MELGKSKEDYLKSILILQMKLNDVHSVNVADYMGVSKASVSVAIKQLRIKNYLSMDDNGNLYLTPKGKSLATQVYERYEFFTKILCKLGIPSDIAEKDACLIEHDISTESYERLKFISTHYSLQKKA